MKDNQIMILNPTENFMTDAGKAGYTWISHTPLHKWKPDCKFILVSGGGKRFGYIQESEFKQFLSDHDEVDFIYDLDFAYQEHLLYDVLDIEAKEITETVEDVDNLFLKVKLEDDTTAEVYSNDESVMLEINGCDTDNDYELSNNYFEFTHEEFKKFAQIVQTMKESLEL